jgi:hypothetical protein
MMRAAYDLRAHITSTPASLRSIELFRAFIAVYVNYIFFCRAETGTRCRIDDLTVDRPSQHICLFARKSKGDHHRDPRDKLVLAVPIPGYPLLADLLDHYLKQRTTFCATFYKRPPHAAIWSFSPFEPSAEWTAAATLSPWLVIALRAINTTT